MNVGEYICEEIHGRVTNLRMKIESEKKNDFCRVEINILRNVYFFFEGTK